MLLPLDAGGLANPQAPRDAARHFPEDVANPEAEPLDPESALFSGVTLQTLVCRIVGKEPLLGLLHVSGR